MGAKDNVANQSLLEVPLSISFARGISLVYHRQWFYFFSPYNLTIRYDKSVYCTFDAFFEFAIESQLHVSLTKLSTHAEAM